MSFLTISLWILLSTQVNAQQEYFQSMSNAVEKVLRDQINETNRPIGEVYQAELEYAAAATPTVVALQNTHANIYILDPSGVIYTRVREHSVGFQLSDIMNGGFMNWDSNSTTLTEPNDIDVLSIVSAYGGDLQSEQTIMDLTHLDSYIFCYGYNLTLVDSKNGTMIEAVTIDKCGGLTLRSFIIGKLSEFCHLKGIRLGLLPLTNLTVKDLMDFTELQMLLLDDIPFTFMENGLFCYNLNITILRYFNSFGYLTIFPHQIFNCSNPLKLEFLDFGNHNIASLPARAFGGAAQHLRVVLLWNIGLEVIHKDAFTGLMNLQVLRLHDNTLVQLSSAMMPPSNICIY